MKAIDIAQPIPSITTGDSVTAAIHQMTEANLPGVVVVDADDRPLTVIPGTQVLKMAVLNAYHDDPALVRTIDEESADTFAHECNARSVGECLPAKLAKPATARSDATLLEVATIMLRGRSPLVAVVDKHKKLVGAVTLTALLGTMAPDAQPA